jgi:hypothetical protein
MKISQLQIVSFCVLVETALAFSPHHDRASVRARISSHAYRPYRGTIVTAQRRREAHLYMGAVSSGTDPSSKIVQEPTFVKDSLAGLTVAFSLLSKAIACSAIVGVNPLVGIWSSVIMGITAPLSECLLAKIKVNCFISSKQPQIFRHSSWSKGRSHLRDCSRGCCTSISSYTSAWC